jgi:hypothetical protein
MGIRSMILVVLLVVLGFLSSCDGPCLSDFEVNFGGKSACES